MNERAEKGPIIVGLAVVFVILLIPVIYLCWTIYAMDRDNNASKDGMIAYYNAHRDDFARTEQVMIEALQDCTEFCEPPDEELAWAGPDAEFYFCDDKADPPMYMVFTPEAVFTYIPGQEAVPTHWWSPCTGIHATCTDLIADYWFRCYTARD